MYKISLLNFFICLLYFAICFVKCLLYVFFLVCRSYSYYIEVSMDELDWVRVVDHSKFLCRSWQHLYFPARVCRYNSLHKTNWALFIFEKHYFVIPLPLLKISRRNYIKTKAKAKKTFCSCQFQKPENLFLARWYKNAKRMIFVCTLVFNII